MAVDATERAAAPQIPVLFLVLAVITNISPPIGIRSLGMTGRANSTTPNNIGGRHPAVRWADELRRPERNQQAIERRPRVGQRYGRSRHSAVIRAHRGGKTG